MKSPAKPETNHFRRQQSLITVVQGSTVYYTPGNRIQLLNSLYTTRDKSSINQDQGHMAASTRTKLQVPFQAVQMHDPSDWVHVEGKFRAFEALLVQSSSTSQAFHPAGFFPNCQIHDNAHPKAILHHQLRSSNIQHQIRELHLRSNTCKQ